jgi:hypothetical protein
MKCSAQLTHRLPHRWNALSVLIICTCRNGITKIKHIVWKQKRCYLLPIYNALSTNTDMCLSTTTNGYYTMEDLFTLNVVQTHRICSPVIGEQFTNRNISYVKVFGICPAPRATVWESNSRPFVLRATIPTDVTTRWGQINGWIHVYLYSVNPLYVWIV